MAADLSVVSQACRGCKNGTETFPFTMAFQPIVDIVEGRIDAHEALVRGPAGEGAGTVLAQVNADNRYAFDQACRVRAIELAARLGLANQPGTHLNINFLPNAVYEPKACIRLTLEAARRTGLPLDRLTFEFVEHEQVADTVHTLRIIKEYRRHGFRVALDDFSTGYSGLARLADLRPDIVKLDRTLIQGCDEDGFRLSIVGALLRLGREIGTKIVIEGVETKTEARALARAGARYMQGYFYAKPLLEGFVPLSQIEL